MGPASDHRNAIPPRGSLDAAADISIASWSTVGMGRLALIVGPFAARQYVQHPKAPGICAIPDLGGRWLPPAAISPQRRLGLARAGPAAVSPRWAALASVLATGARAGRDRSRQDNGHDADRAGSQGMSWGRRLQCVDTQGVNDRLVVPVSHDPSDHREAAAGFSHCKYDLTFYPLY